MSDSDKKSQTGHHFLASLGKTRLRPGGRRATDWLIEQAQFTPQTQVLEVACNMATTAIGLAQRFGCHINGVDLDHHALEKAPTTASMWSSTKPCSPCCPLPTSRRRLPNISAC